MQPVKILSYNMYCLPSLVTAFSPSSCPLSQERSTGFLRHIQSYDILGFQEVWDPCYKKIEKHARLNNMHVVGSSSPTAARYFSLRVFGGGLMIVSKHPIVESQELIFGGGSQSDRFVSKGVLYAKIKVESSYIHVFNTHLQASYGYEWDFVNNPYMAMRHKQLKKISAFIEKMTSKDQYPIMVMGDFNVNARAAPNDGSDSKEYLDMIRILRSRSYEIVDVLKEHNGGEHPITYGGKGVLPNEKPKAGGQRLDFLLELKRDTSAHNFEYKMSGGHVEQFKVTGEKYTHYSDHYAQTVVMEIQGADKAIELPPVNSLAQASISLGA